MKKPTPPQGQFDLLVFVGRFQPFHLGHQAVIDLALQRAKNVLVLVGSANAPRSPRNPFSYDERKQMIRATIPDERLIIRPIGDHLYNDPAWIAAVQHEVYDVLDTLGPASKRLGIIGHAKDHSSYYLTIFPGYEVLNVAGVTSPTGELINATEIREAILANNRAKIEYIPHAVRERVTALLPTAPLQAVIQENIFAKAYKAQWRSTPFPVTFNTVDAVVQQSGHVLMVIRKEQPGLGMLALPGGFLKQDETLLDGALRELNEETQIDVPRRVLLGAKKSERTFDDPHRSSRGRTITHAFRFDLSEKRLPNVKGGDDAAAARWVPLADIRPETCFEDHAYIIRTMLGVS